MRFPRRRASLRFALILIGLLVALVALSFLHPRVRYVAMATTYQLEVLWGRVPVEDAIAAGHFTDEEAARLRQVPAMKEHAKRMGLADTGHYSTVNPTWARTVWNVSACEPLSFTPRTWWFPIVGEVPYLGDFDEAQAREWAADMEAQGLDVHVRTAGAWSTLGWFEDPLLPPMATWTESRLSNTLHHELTHATVWIPGSVAFNESFAQFVGEEAGLAYLIERYGDDSEQVQEERDRRADRAVFMKTMRDTYQELDAIYTDPTLGDADKLAKKQAILAALPSRVRNAGFRDPERWVAWFEKDPWNNARLVQFRVYNRSPEWFEAILEQEDRDLSRFLRRIEAITAGKSDPYRAVAKAAGLSDAEIDEALAR